MATSILRNVYDERTFDTVRSFSRRHFSCPSEKSKRIMGEFARECRRQGWTWKLIGYTMTVSASSARYYATTY